MDSNSEEDLVPKKRIDPKSRPYPPPNGAGEQAEHVWAGTAFSPALR